MRSLINFRDRMGRTALHIAAMWNNKVGVEQLLYSHANPHIEDGGGYRPIDYVDPKSAIADQLKNFMTRLKPVLLHPADSEEVQELEKT